MNSADAATALSAPATPSILGGGETGDLIRAFDWAATPLGRLDAWPAYLRAAVNLALQSPVPMALLWGEAGVMIYNHAYAVFSGEKHPAILGKNVREAWPEVKDFIDGFMTAVLAGNALYYPSQRLVLCRNGTPEEVWLDLNHSPLLDEQGRVVGVLAVVVDTTARIRAEQRQQEAQQARAETERQFRTLADNIPNLAWMAAPDGWVFWYNNRWYEYTGATPEQMAGWGWQSVHDPQVLPEVMARWNASLAHGEPFEMMFPLRGANGAFRLFLTRVLPVRNESGQVERWLGTNTDITARHDIEMALKDREARLNAYATQQKAIADFSLQAITGVDSITGITRLALGMVSDVLGVTYSKVLQRVPGTQNKLYFLAVNGFQPELVGQVFEPGAEPHAAYTLTALTPVVVDDLLAETRFKPSPILLQYGLISGVSVVIYAAGKPFGVLEVDAREKRRFTETEVSFLQTVATLIGTVIERKQAEALLAKHHEKLQETAARLEASNQDLSQFAFVVSHDLQAPLRKVFLFSEFLKEKEAYRLSTEGRDYIERMQRALNRMQQLIQGILTLAKIDRPQEEWTLMRLSEVTPSVLEDLAAEIQKSGARVEMGSDCTFRGDKPQIAQLLLNLVGNALKYHRPEAPPRVQIDCAPIDAQWVQLTVSDNGIGIEAAHYGKIFEVFQRLHPSEDYQGTGIGLAIVKRIVARHHGFIAVESEVGQGSTFTIRLPAR